MRYLIDTNVICETIKTTPRTGVKNEVVWDTGIKIC